MRKPCNGAMTPSALGTSKPSLGSLPTIFNGTCRAKNLVSGDYSGKEQVGGFFGKLMEPSDGTFSVDVHDIMANDEHAVGLVVPRAEKR